MRKAWRAEKICAGEVLASCLYGYHTVAGRSGCLDHSYRLSCTSWRTTSSILAYSRSRRATTRTIRTELSDIRSTVSPTSVWRTIMSTCFCSHCDWQLSRPVAELRDLASGSASVVTLRPPRARSFPPPDPPPRARGLARSPRARSACRRRAAAVLHRPFARAPGDRHCSAAP